MEMFSYFLKYWKACNINKNKYINYSNNKYTPDLKSIKANDKLNDNTINNI